jgi:general secretion pathway protein A
VYKSFFGLKKNPFNVNPDPAYLYLTPQMRQASDELTYGLESRKGLMLLTGEVGTGKTTLINQLLLWLGHQHAKTAFIFNSHLDSEQLFDFILSDFDIPLTAETKINPLLAFNEWLLARYRAHDLVVLIVDEAQGLPVHVLEEIRLLLNMETPSEKLLQIVLAGQPELENKLKRPDLRQLQQRIALRCKTAPLTLQETFGYIEDRLHTAGATGETFFTSEAVEAIYSYSRGIPRVINLLCENALINAYVEQERLVASSYVDEAARELQFDELKPAAPRLKSVSHISETPDLHTLLEKIKADAEIGHTWPQSSLKTPSAAPYLVAPKTVDHPRTADATLGTGRISNGQIVPRTVPVITSDSYRAAITSKKSKKLKTGWPSDLLATGRDRIGALHRVAGTRAGIAVDFLRGLDVDGKLDAFVSLAGITTQNVFTHLSRSVDPEFKAGVVSIRSAVGMRAQRVRGWCAKSFGEEMCGKTFVAMAGIAVLLYLIARKMNPSQGWQHPGLLVVGFAGSLLCLLSLALGVAILVRSRQKLREDSSVLLTHAVRWLQAPIYPMQIREIGPVGKQHAQRRAS